MSPSGAAATDNPVCWTADSLCRESLPSAGARRKYGSHLSHHMPNTACKVQKTRANNVNLIISTVLNQRFTLVILSMSLSLRFMCKKRTTISATVTRTKKWWNKWNKKSCSLPHLELRWDTPSSTQQRLVFWSPTSTTQALLKPLPKVAHTDSWCTMMARQTHTHTCRIRWGATEADLTVPEPHLYKPYTLICV